MSPKSSNLGPHAQRVVVLEFTFFGFAECDFKRSPWYLDSNAVDRVAAHEQERLPQNTSGLSPITERKRAGRLLMHMVAASTGRYARTALVWIGPKGWSTYGKDHDARRDAAITDYGCSYSHWERNIRSRIVTEMADVLYVLMTRPHELEAALNAREHSA